MLMYHLAVFKFLLPECIPPQSEDDIELYRNVTSLHVHHRFFAFVACLIDVMPLLGLSLFYID